MAVFTIFNLARKAFAWMPGRSSAPPRVCIWNGLTTDLLDQTSCGSPSTRARGTENKIPLPGSQRSPHKDLTMSMALSSVSFSLTTVKIVLLEDSPLAIILLISSMAGPSAPAFINTRPISKLINANINQTIDCGYEDLLKSGDFMKLEID